MKRMVMIALVMVATAVSQAATIQWGSLNAAYFGDNKLSGAVNDNGTGYLLVFEGNGGAVAAGMITAAYNLWKNATPYSSVVAGPSVSALAGIMGGNMSATDGAAIGSSGLNLTEDVTYFANIFFTTRDGVDYVYQSGSTLYDQQGTAWVPASSTLDIRTAMPTGTSWTVVPEPTSMALLAIGVVALGLRRKFNK